MKIYFSYKQFPELAGYTEHEKRIIWINFVLSSEGASWFEKRGKTMELVLFSGFLLGLLAGPFFFHQSGIATLAGLLVGGLGGIIVPLFIWNVATKPEMRRHLCDYMASSEFKLEPMNQRARMFIAPLCWRRPDED